MACKIGWPVEKEVQACNIISFSRASLNAIAVSSPFTEDYLFSRTITLLPLYSFP